MKKNILSFVKILFAVISVLALLSQSNVFAKEECPKGQKMIDGKCVRTLENVYPNSLGYAPQTIAEGLPSYVKYIFNFSILIVGFIILYVITYAGFRYLTSSGNPNALSDARSRILEGLLGGAILLGSYLVFNTINPQLTIIDIDPVRPARPTVLSGIYVCTKSFNNNEKENLNNAIETYKDSSNISELKSASEVLGGIMKSKNCQLLSTSGSFPKKITKNNVIFTVPNIKNSQFFIDQGLILHEKDSRVGKCFIVNPYSEIKANTPLNFDFDARAFTLYKSPDEEKDENTAKLFSCLNYNRQGNCNIGKQIQPKQQEVRSSTSNEEQPLSNDLKENVRSIELGPNNNFFAVLIGQNKERCEVITGNDPNLLDNDIGRCGSSCRFFFFQRETEEKVATKCTPCAESIQLIKGSVL